MSIMPQIDKINVMNTFKLISKWVLGLFFVSAGISHFVLTDFFVRIVPPYIPWPLAMVYVSGIFEVLLGVLLFIPRWSALAAWGLIALLIAVFPANIHMAVHAEEFADIASPAGLWMRLPLQAVLIAWAFWFTRKP
jgi:uncharacterized membrane protein